MARAAKTAPAFAHWSHQIDNFQASTLEFYTAIEQAVRERQVPDIQLSRVDWKEGGIFSAKREYLRVRRKELVFDICGAPYGTGFFFSWWQAEVPAGLKGLLLSIPYAGVAFAWLYLFFANPDTYYKQDSRLMFQKAIHQATMSVIDQMTDAKGVRALSELERKPIMGELFRPS